MPLSPGVRLGHYEIVSALGAGGMGEVYRARDDRIGRDVAVKVLPAAFAENEDRLRRFEQEARAAGRLNHPNVLTVHDVDLHLLPGARRPLSGRGPALSAAGAPSGDGPTRASRYAPGSAIGS